MKLTTLAYLILITLMAAHAPAAHAQTFSVIHNFQGPEGYAPYTGVTLRGGILYGTAVGGGNGCGMSRTCGTAYQVKRSGSDWVTSAISLFPTSGQGAGINPTARVVFGPNGHAYGTTSNGAGRLGVVYRMTPPISICKAAACLWTTNEIHDFTGVDGAEPGYGDLIWDQQGNIYGTTGQGGTGCGVVFEMTGSGNNWTETPIYTFASSGDGCNPQNGVVMDGNGNLFGTTWTGGAHSNGTVYELTYDPQAGWKETTLYTFTGTGNDGGQPFAGVILDASGNLYGATYAAVFELSPSGNTWTFQVLYEFTILNGYSGPAASLTLDAAGNLYGTTYSDGAYNQGSIFKLSNTGNGWVYTSLHDFTGGADGAFPRSQVTIDTDGTLYGTASQGGSTHDYGVVWMIKP